MEPAAPTPPNATDAAAALAEEKGLDLATVTGTGADDKITVDDVRKAVAARDAADAEEAAGVLFGLPDDDEVAERLAECGAEELALLERFAGRLADGIRTRRAAIVAEAAEAAEGPRVEMRALKVVPGELYGEMGGRTEPKATFRVKEEHVGALVSGGFAERAGG